MIRVGDTSYCANIPGKRLFRMEVPLLLADGQVEWRLIEEFDTTNPIVDGLADDYFETVVEVFLANGTGHQSTIGDAASVLVSAADIVDFAIQWLENRV